MGSSRESVLSAEAEATSARREEPARQGTTALPVRGRRRPWLIALGLLFASVGALLVVWMVGAAGQRQEVLVVRHELVYGDEVTASDIGIARVSVDPGVEVIPANRRAAVLGQVVTSRLTPGTLLTDQALSSEAGPSVGQVLVPLALPIERMPAGGLRAGDRILAVPIQSSQGVAGASYLCVVARVGDMDVNGVTVVDVTTAAANGPGLTVSAAADQIAIVVLPSGR